MYELSSCKLSKMWTCPEKGQRETRGRRNNWRTEEIRMAGKGKGIFFILGGTVSFWGTGPERRTVLEGCSSRSECNPALPCHLWREKRSYSPDIVFFKRVDRFESSKEPEPVPSTSGVSEIAACPHLLLLTILQLYHLPPPLPPPVSNSSCLFTWCQPLDASCCTVPLYFSRSCTIRLKMFSLFFVVFLCIICMKSIINLLPYSTI